MKKIWLVLLSIVLICLLSNSGKVFAQQFCNSDSDCIGYCHNKYGGDFTGVCDWWCPWSNYCGNFCRCYSFSNLQCTNHNTCYCKNVDRGCCIEQCGSNNYCHLSPTNTDYYSTAGCHTGCPSDQNCGTDCQCHATITTTTPPQCTEGNYRCAGQNLERCTSGKWQFVQSCVYGCSVDHCLGANTTTTTSMTTTTTTTTSTSPPPLSVKCDICFSNSPCKCFLEGNCVQGFWILKNLKGTPIAETIENIPPTNLFFTPTSTGKANITVACSIPQGPSGWSVVDVQTEILQCPSLCQANTNCKCDVIGCSSGVFSVENVEGDSISNSVSIPIASSPFAGQFTPVGFGKSKVSVNCAYPSATAFKYVTTEGKKVGGFKLESFSCEKSETLRCIFKYNNTLDQDVTMAFFISDSKGVVKKVVKENLGKGFDILLKDFACSDLKGTNQLSWKFYKSQNILFPFAWSTSNQIQKMECG